MNVNATIRAKMRQAPDLYGSRYAVLILMFMGVGNTGWRDGELVDFNPPSPEAPEREVHDTVDAQYTWILDQFFNSPRVALEALQTYSADDMVPDWVWEEASEAYAPLPYARHHRMHKRAVEHVEQVIRVRREFEQFVVDRTPPASINTFEAYTPLANLPDDITEDWLAAAAELCDLLEICPTQYAAMAVEVGPGLLADTYREKGLAEAQANKRFARDLRARIATLRRDF
jgi:hypothetical protein